MAEELQVVVYHRQRKGSEISVEKGDWHTLPQGIVAAERATVILNEIEDAISLGKQPFSWVPRRD